MNGGQNFRADESKKTGLLNTLWLWIKDLIEVGVTVLVLIIVLKMLFGSKTLVPLVVVTSGSMLHVGGGWHTWLADNLDDPSVIDSFKFQNGFARGDMIFTVSPGKYHIIPDTKLGDVVIYERDLAHLHQYSSTEPIIHRVVGVITVNNEEVVQTEGALVCLTDQTIKKTIQNIKVCREGLEGCPYTKYPDSGSYNIYVTKGDNNPSADQCGLNGGIALPVNEAQLKARGWVRLPYIGWIKLLFNDILNLIFSIIR